MEILDGNLRRHDNRMWHVILNWILYLWRTLLEQSVRLDRVCGRCSNHSYPTVAKAKSMPVLIKDITKATGIHTYTHNNTHLYLEFFSSNIILPIFKLQLLKKASYFMCHSVTFYVYDSSILLMHESLGGKKVYSFCRATYNNLEKKKPTIKQWALESKIKVLLFLKIPLRLAVINKSR